MQNSVVIITLGTLVVVTFIYFAWVGSQLSAKLIGPDIGSYYIPIVRHVIGPNQYCFDPGTSYCEEHYSTQPDSTVGYIFQNRPSGLSAQPLWACKEGAQYALNINKDRCNKQGRIFLGYVSMAQTFETPLELVTCYNQAKQQYILTDNQTNCITNGFQTKIMSLGYIAPSNFFSQSN